MAGVIMDYSGLCFEAMEEQGLSYEECKDLRMYLNAKEKWIETVLQSNCT